MISADLTVKNYRCFSDEAPLHVRIDSGFISFVGKNNSGKSSILKFFFEFRHLWENLTGTRNHATTLMQGHANFGYMRNIDPQALFYSGNKRNIIIEIDVRNDEQQHDVEFSNFYIRKVVIEIPRENTNNPIVTYLDSRDNALANEARMVNHGGTSPVLESRTISESVIVRSESIDKLFMALAKVLYIGPFRNAINSGSADYYDLKVGEAFISQWDNWKNGGMRKQNEAIARVVFDIRNMFQYRYLEINASPDNRTLKIIANDNPHEMEELGAGLAQFIIVLGNASISSPSFILIDEPELHLHPSLQIDFITSLARYSTYGVMFATHSLGLARSVSDRIYSCRPLASNTSVSPLESTPNYIEFLGEMGFSAYKEMGYDSILLVEGVSEVKAIQQFLRMLKKDHKIVIIPLGGDQLAKGGVEQELSEFNRLADNIYALVDSEKSSPDSDPKRERKEFKKVCEGLGFKVHLTEKRAMENYFTDRAVKDCLGDSFSAIGPYELLRSSQNPWSKKDNWRIASFMTEEELSQTDVGHFLASIA